ncbi:7624_t:CDS:2 [Paraglomus brasilianum]|uniref:7624_t:CDS:1 n=1 Tax=Paraglomus brasilianum TaxID=144538 RepID=A0A9N9D5G1_9GLOM|nr:7624_t:CDS:2 [Paraglomus brasilianum]
MKDCDGKYREECSEEGCGCMEFDPADSEPATLLEFMEKILSNATPSTQHGKSSTIDVLIPLVDREETLKKSMDIVHSNIERLLRTKPPKTVPKADQTIILCAGTAGIGKTRYGRELYSALEATKQHTWNKMCDMLSKCEHKLMTNVEEVEQLVANSYSVTKFERPPIPHYEYIMIDFSNGMILSDKEEQLSAEVILSLRVAFVFFIWGKYQMSFSEFRHEALQHNNKGLFKFPIVVESIRNRLNLVINQYLFLFIHLDEVQLILSSKWNGPFERKAPAISDILPSDTDPPTMQGMCFLKDILFHLGNYMIDQTSNIFIQTFISGTARSKVLEATKPTLYNIAPIRCPMLSISSCIFILKHFMNLLNIADHLWVPHFWLLELLSDTGGLPRALQYFLEELFGVGLQRKEDFLNNLQKLHTKKHYFNKLVLMLDGRYALESFAEKNQALICELIRRCICQISSRRSETVPHSDPLRTFDDLESELHMILEDQDDCDKKVLVQIPFLFLHSYNKAILEGNKSLQHGFVQNWYGEYKAFEEFCVEYTAYCTNIFVDCGFVEMNLGEFFCDAYGQREVLELPIRLKKLALVKARHHFPTFKLSTIDSNEIDWQGHFLIVNAQGAEFSDAVFTVKNANRNDEEEELYQKLISGKITAGNNNNNQVVTRNTASNLGWVLFDDCKMDVTMGLQMKNWISTDITLIDIQSEHTKNINTIKKLRGSSLYSSMTWHHIITVLITTAKFKDDPKNIPKDCLLICHANYHDYFGDPFSSRAILFEMKNNNPNYADKDILIKKHKFKEDDAQAIIENRPYASPEDILRVVPAAKRKVIESWNYAPIGDNNNIDTNYPKKKQRV